MRKESSREREKARLNEVTRELEFGSDDGAATEKKVYGSELEWNHVFLFFGSVDFDLIAIGVIELIF